jgi:hypothetical protein
MAVKYIKTPETSLAVRIEFISYFFSITGNQTIKLPKPQSNTRLPK